MQLALFPAPATFEQLTLELFTTTTTTTTTTERHITTMQTTTSPTHRRRSAQALLVILAAIVAVVFTVGQALAHHPELTGSTTCRTAGAPWTATWTARADQTRGLTWQIAGYTPAGPQADNITLQRSASYPEGQTSATETATASWSNGATGTRSATVQRPPLCPPASTTTTAPAETTTTTTAPEETTTTTAPPATTTPASTTTSSTVLVAVTDPPVPSTSIVQPPRFPAPTALPETGPSSITPWALLIGAAAIAAGLLTLRRARR